MAACEAALESGYGRSVLAVEDRNLFGMKQHQHPEYGTATLPTNEFYGGEWKTVEANWVVYPDWQACFKDRMATLKRLAPVYQHYKNALAEAGSGTILRLRSFTHLVDRPEKGGEGTQMIYDAVAGDWSAT